MPYTKDYYVRIARKFLNVLKQDGIDVSQAYLFGSVTKGQSDEESDIDLAVVSRDFVGVPYYDYGKISRQRRNVDLRLEIHPFALNEVETDPSLFFLNIKDTGLRVS